MGSFYRIKVREGGLIKTSLTREYLHTLLNCEVQMQKYHGVMSKVFQAEGMEVQKPRGGKELETSGDKGVFCGWKEECPVGQSHRNVGPPRLP